MDNQKPIIVFLGPQGSGKGTQGKKLATRQNLPYLETGQLFRDEIESGSEAGKHIASIIDGGTLLPDEYLNNFMKDKIIAALSQGGVILDGYPRRIGQAEALAQIAAPTMVILIDIPDKESIRRLSARRMCPTDKRIYNLVTAPPKNDEVCDDCGSKLIQRDDDTLSAIKHRLEQYHNETEPIIAYYKKQGILHRLDGMPSIEEVEKAVGKVYETQDISRN